MVVLPICTAHGKSIPYDTPLSCRSGAVTCCKATGYIRKAIKLHKPFPNMTRPGGLQAEGLRPLSARLDKTFIIKYFMTLRAHCPQPSDLSVILSTCSNDVQTTSKLRWIALKLHNPTPFSSKQFWFYVRTCFFIFVSSAILSTTSSSQICAATSSMIGLCL